MGVYVVFKFVVVCLIEVLVEELKDCGVIVNVVLLSIIDIQVNCIDMLDVDVSCWVMLQVLVKVIVFLLLDDVVFIIGVCLFVGGWV